MTGSFYRGGTKRGLDRSENKTASTVKAYAYSDLTRTEVIKLNATLYCTKLTEDSALSQGSKQQKHAQTTSHQPPRRACYNLDLMRIAHSLSGSPVFCLGAILHLRLVSVIHCAPRVTNPGSCDAPSVPALAHGQHEHPGGAHGTPAVQRATPAALRQLPITQPTTQSASPPARQPTSPPASCRSSWTS